MHIKNPPVFKKHTLTHLATACYLMLLSGCISMSGINPQAKLTEANQLGAGQTITSTKKIAWPKEDWWKTFNDAQLDALIAQAITDSPTLHIAQARVRLSQAYADSMQAETKPNISADASTIRERFTELQFIPPPWDGNFAWNNKATLSLAYDLDLWGRQESAWHASVDESQAASAEVQQVKLALESAIVRSYVQLAMQFSLRDIAEERLLEIQQRVSIAQRSRAAGLGTEMEVREAETALPMARAHIESINAHISLLRNQLAALSGRGPAAGDAIARPKMHLNVPFGLPDQLPANLIGRRPDVLAFRWKVEAAQQNIESAKAMFYPNINLLGFIGFQALGFGQLISSAANIAGAGPALSLPIFDGGRRRGNLSAKTASYDIAVESYNDILVHALQDVSDQLVTLQSNSKQRSEAEQALTSALQANTLAERSYHAGLSNYQHVLDTKSVVLHYEEIIAQLQAVKLDSYANLMRALGGGIIEPSQPETGATQSP